jgi:Sulfotransferase domain
MTMPTFLIIGAMKSGSTALARLLGEHPSVFVPAVKEIHYFDENFEKGPAWYERHFDDAGTAAAIGEATPRYMASPEYIARMADLLPDAKLICALRNPVDRAYSHYWHAHTRGDDARTFDDAIHDELARAARQDASPFGYLERGRYLRQVHFILERYPREQLCVILAEDLRDQPAATYAEVCRFLEVADDFVAPSLGTRVNASVDYRWLRVQLALNRLPRRIRYRVGKWNRRARGYPPLDPAIRARLEEFYADDNVALASWLGRDLHEWAPHAVA